MSRLSPTKKRILFLFLMVIGGSIFTLVYLAATGNTAQVYSEIIVEWTSIYSSNKSAERNLLFMLIFGGLIIYATFYLFTKREWDDREFISTFFRVDNSLKTKEFMCALISISGIYFLVFNNTYSIITASLIYVVIVFIIDKELIYTGICIYYLGIYALCGFYRLYVLTGGQNNANSMMIAITAFLISLIPLTFKNQKKKFYSSGDAGRDPHPIQFVIVYGKQIQNRGRRYYYRCSKEYKSNNHFYYCTVYCRSFLHSHEKME